MPDQTDGVDFALAAYREEGVCRFRSRPRRARRHRQPSHALRRFPGDGGSVGMIGIDEDFFVLVRVAGANTRVLLSDFTAADEWEASSVRPSRVLVACPSPRTTTSRPWPATSVSSATSACTPWTWACSSTTTTCTDEMLSDVARRLGFGPLFDETVGLASA